MGGRQETWVALEEYVDPCRKNIVHFWARLDNAPESRTLLLSKVRLPTCQGSMLPVSCGSDEDGIWKGVVGPYRLASVSLCGSIGNEMQELSGSTALEWHLTPMA